MLCGITVLVKHNWILSFPLEALTSKVNCMISKGKKTNNQINFQEFPGISRNFKVPVFQLFRVLG